MPYLNIWSSILYKLKNYLKIKVKKYDMDIPVTLAVFT